MAQQSRTIRPYSLIFPCYPDQARDITFKRSSFGDQASKRCGQCSQNRFSYFRIHERDFRSSYNVESNLFYAFNFIFTLNYSQSRRLCGTRSKHKLVLLQDDHMHFTDIKPSMNQIQTFHLIQTVVVSYLNRGRIAADAGL